MERGAVLACGIEGDGDTRAVGNVINGDVVEIEVAVAVVVAGIGWRHSVIERNVFASSSVAVEIDFKLVYRESRLVLEVDGVDTDESADIVGVGHHTHEQTAGVVVGDGAVAAHLEADLQCVDGGSKHRHSGIAIGRCGAGRAGLVAVEVEATVAVDGVGGVGIGIGGGAVGTLCPAGVESDSRTGTVAFEVLGEGQRHCRAGGGEGGHDRPVAHFATAVSADVEVVACVGGEGVDGNIIVGDSGGCHACAVGVETGGSDDVLVVAGIADPIDGDGGILKAGDGDIGRTCAAGYFGAEVEGQIDAVVCACGRAVGGGAAAIAIECQVVGRHRTIIECTAG